MCIESQETFWRQNRRIFMPVLLALSLHKRKYQHASSKKVVLCFFTSTKPEVDKWGESGSLPLEIWTPPVTPPLKSPPPPLNHFWVGLPYLKKFDSPTSEVLAPLPEKFWFLQKRSQSPGWILETPPLRISELDSPTSKILAPLLENFLNFLCTQTPLVQFWGLPPSGFQSWTPLPEKIWLP